MSHPRKPKDWNEAVKVGLSPVDAADRAWAEERADPTPPAIPTKLLKNAKGIHAPATNGATTPEQPQTAPLDVRAKLSDVIPPRQWLLGSSLCREFVSGVTGAGGTGKTAFAIAQAVALASGKGITGEYVHKQSRVLYLSLEDNIDEIERRIQACLLHHGVLYPEGSLFYASPGRRSGRLVDQALMVSDLTRHLQDAILRSRIDVVVLDPLVKAHALDENSNTAMDVVVSLLAELAIAGKISVYFLHHTSKGVAEAGNADRGRGASALKDGGRLMKTLTVMSPEEAKAFGITDEAERRSLIRLDTGKVNLAPAEHAIWFKLVNVNIGNGTPEYRNGDDVQTVERWMPPDAFEGLSNFICNSILNQIQAAWDAGTAYGAEAHSERQVWQVVAETAGKDMEASKRIIKKWLETGLLLKDVFKNENRKERKGVRVDNAKRPG